MWLPTSRRDLLQRICAQPRASVGIVSGRRLADVRLRTGLPARRIYVAGLHGLEIDGAGERFVHPAIDEARVRGQQIAAELRTVISPIPGVFIEDKELSVALHFRRAQSRHQHLVGEIFDEIVRAPLAAGDVRVMRGSCVLEVLPNIAWNKGNAVQWICDRVARGGDSPFIVYIGDDTTDEDAFRVIPPDGVRIAASERVTGAHYLVDGPAEVERVLAEVAR